MYLCSQLQSVGEKETFMGVNIQGVDISLVMSRVLCGYGRINFYYDDWSEDTRKKEIDNSFKILNEQFSKIDFTKCTKDELLSLGFSEFCDFDCEPNGLMLIPIWLYDALPDGIELRSILNYNVIKGKDYIDLDTRGGYLAFGIKINEIKGE